MSTTDMETTLPGEETPPEPDPWAGEEGNAAVVPATALRIKVPEGAEPGDVLEVKTEDDTIFTTIPDGVEVSLRRLLGPYFRVRLRPPRTWLTHPDLHPDYEAW